jgi:hypothetical protein
VSCSCGIFYHLHPAIDRSRIASVQVWIWIASTVILTVGVGLVYTGHAIGDPIAAIGSIIILFGEGPTRGLSLRGARFSSAHGSTVSTAYGGSSIDKTIRFYGLTFDRDTAPRRR